MSLKKSCDFCVRRKRSCDGFSRRRCSYCIATNQPECHYQPRRRWGSRSSVCDYTTARALVGRSFWRVDGETTPPALTEGDRHFTRVGSGSSDECLILPLKRGRFSPSPATGLIGLQENEFLGDFFGCLGFLSLASESTVRGAMVGVMLAGGQLQHRYRPGVDSPSRSSPGLAQEDAGSVGESSDGIGDIAWRISLTAEAGSSGVLPRDPATCVLWCAIALGALVRGTPLDHVGCYIELAQDSLLVCGGGATLGTARAYVAMAVVYNFLDDQVKNHEYCKRANSIVDGLPPEEIPRGFRELLQYAGFAWAMEAKLASVEDTNGYWENIPPIWELSESVVEEDVCGFVLAVTLRVNQPFIDETGVGHVFVANQQQQQLSGVVTPVVATGPPVQNPHLQHAEEVDRVCLANAGVCAEVQKKSVLPEVLRLGECIEKSTTRFGLGGLLYYGELGYLQLLNKEAASKVSLQRCVGVIVRYPGLCRYNVWLHFVHSVLYALTIFQSRNEYEALRASYNSARPVGFPPAPPLEGWRGMSDICDHACCRRIEPQVQSASAWVSTADDTTTAFLEARENGGPEPYVVL